MLKGWRCISSSCGFSLLTACLYVLYTIISGEWRALVPVPGSLKRALQVTLYDLHLSKHHPPQGKYNDAQRMAYTGVILMGAGSLLTGLAIYKPVSLRLVDVDAGRL
ncbi:MAG: cytochrome b/b6 domain-containing protein [Pyrinomonadaceae bacterium]